MKNLNNAPTANLLALYRAWEAARGAEQEEAEAALLQALEGAEWGEHAPGVFVTARRPSIGADPVRTLWVNGAAVARTRWLETALWPLESRYVRTRAEAQKANRGVRNEGRARHEAYLAALETAVRDLLAGRSVPHRAGQEGGVIPVEMGGRQPAWVSARGALRRCGLSREAVNALIGEGWDQPMRKIALPLAHALQEGTLPEPLAWGMAPLAARASRRAGRRVRVRDL